jgi:hypothetical protein
MHALLNSMHGALSKDRDMDRDDQTVLLITVHILSEGCNNIFTLLTRYMKEVGCVGTTTAVDRDRKYIFKLPTCQQNAIDVRILINKPIKIRYCQTACWKERTL